MKNGKVIAIIGTAGIPARYGGFETLAENLVNHHQANALPGKLIVYCSGKGNPQKPRIYQNSELRYINLPANGIMSILYDSASMLSAIRRGCDVILLLGVSGAITLPLLRLFSTAQLVTNVDGVEWKREKWSGFARWWLRMSELIAVRFSHKIVADNGGIASHIQSSYGRNCEIIAYGGDHAVVPEAGPYLGTQLPPSYALALCRIEPENNVSLILEAFADKKDLPLVFIGNWDNSTFGRLLKSTYAHRNGVYLIDPIYDAAVLKTIRQRANLYIHGHSAGGTNPSLVEMMHFGVPVLAYDCVYNRHTTENEALFFETADELYAAAASLAPNVAKEIGAKMLRIARSRYTWDSIGQQYFTLLS